jgi:hypothetical protein
VTADFKLNTHDVHKAVDCLHLTLKPLPLDRPFLVEFADHRLKSSLRTIDLRPNFRSALMSRISRCMTSSLAAAKGRRRARKRGWAGLSQGAPRRKLILSLPSRPANWRKPFGLGSTQRQPIIRRTTEGVSESGQEYHQERRTIMRRRAADVRASGGIHLLALSLNLSRTGILPGCLSRQNSTPKSLRLTRKQRLMEAFPPRPERPLRGKRIGFACLPVWEKKENGRH